MFRQWTGLELAVFHQWGGPSSTDRAEVLMEEVLGMFQGVDKIYKDVRNHSTSEIADIGGSSGTSSFFLICSADLGFLLCPKKDLASDTRFD